MSPRSAEERALIDRILHAIVWVRGHDVLLEQDMANILGIPLALLLQLMHDHAEWFAGATASGPYSFRLSADEYRCVLRSALVELDYDRSRPPLAFTLHGVGMVASRLGKKIYKQRAETASYAFQSLGRRAKSIQDIARQVQRLQSRLNRQLPVFYKAADEVQTILLDLARLLDQAQASGLGDSDGVFYCYQPY